MVFRLSDSRARRLILQFASGVGLFITIQPILALTYAAAYAATAAALRGLFPEWAEALLRALLHDSRHAKIAADAMQDIRVTGLAVSGPLEDVLRWVAPGWLIPSSLVSVDRLSTAVVEPGSTLFAGVATDLVALTLLLALARGVGELGRRTRRSWLAVSGMIAQVTVALEILRQPLALRDLDTIGLSTVATKVFQATVPDYKSFLAPFERAEEAGIPIAPLMLFVAVAILIYAAPWAACLFVRGFSRIRPGVEPVVVRERRSPRRTWARTLGMRGLPILCAALATLSPLQWARGGASFLTIAIDKIPEPSPAQAGELDTGVPQGTPSVVQITGEHPHYQLVANGNPLRIRGMGYNVYASHLSDAERSAHYERDFQVMRNAGINAILGWEQSEFDEVMLDAAQEAGLWVILPFQLPPQMKHINYTDPASREALKASLASWVMRFRAHPALLMYAPGNEVLTAMRTYFRESRRQQRAYASFFREAVDLIHRLDPSHPVICREAEVGHLDTLRDAFRDNVDRPWLVLGTNLYGTLDTFRAGLTQRSESSWRLPAIVTEFSPVGYRRRDRPYLVTRMTETVESAGLLGWVLYVWTTEGPEPLDRTFGLVDGYARPVDETLLALRTFNRTGNAAPAINSRRAVAP